MVKITNGKNVFDVTKGAYEGIFKNQGYEIFNPENPAHERRKEGRNVPVALDGKATHPAHGSLGMEKCYIYAFDINDKKIVAALPSEGVVEAYQACEKANDELKRSGLEHDSLRFGVADLHRKTRTSIGLKQVIEIMYFGGGRPQKPVDVPVEDFETAALHTKDMLSKIQTLDNVPIEIQFMQFVEAILPTCTVNVLPNPYNSIESARAAEHEQGGDEIQEGYALAFRRGYAETLFDNRNVKDKIDNAVSAVSIGKLTVPTQFVAFLKQFGKQDNRGWNRDGGHIVTFLIQRQIPANSVLESQLHALLGTEIPRTGYMAGYPTQQETALDIAVNIADAIRARGGVTNEPVQVDETTEIPLLAWTTSSIIKNITQAVGKTVVVTKSAPANAAPPGVADFPRLTQAASGRGNPKSATPVMTAAEAAYNESIEWTDDPVDMKLVNEDSLADKIGKSVAEHLKPMPIYRVPAPTDATIEPVVDADTSAKKKTDTRTDARKNYDSQTNEGKYAIKQNAALYACKNENLHMDIEDIEILFGCPKKSLNRDPFKGIIKRGRSKARQERRR